MSSSWVNKLVFRVSCYSKKLIMEISVLFQNVQDLAIRERNVNISFVDMLESLSGQISSCIHLQLYFTLRFIFEKKVAGQFLQDR